MLCWACHIRFEHSASQQAVTAWLWLVTTALAQGVCTVVCLDVVLTANARILARLTNMHTVVMTYASVNTRIATCLFELLPCLLLVHVLQGLCTYTAVGVDAAGLVSPADVVAALTPNTVLVTIMHSNNEVRARQSRRETVT